MVKVGFKSYVGYAVEASFGTIVQPSKFVEFFNESLAKTREEVLVDSVNGTPQYKRRFYGQEAVNGSIEVPVVPGSCIQLLNYALGSITTVSLAAGVYSHTFLARTSSFSYPGLSFQIARDTGDTSASYQYGGVKINSIGFNCGVNGMLRASIDLQGRTESSANTIATASYRNYAPYFFNGCTIKVGDNTTTSTLVSADTWSCNIANNNVESYEFGTSTRCVIESGMQDVTMEIGKRWDNNDLYNRFINGTKSYVETIFDTGVTIASTYTHKMVFQAYNCYFNGNTGNIDGAGNLIKANYPIRCVYEDASVSTIKVTVISDLASLTA